MSKWYRKDGNENDVIVASSVNVARNLTSTPFPCRMNNDIRRAVCKKVYASIQNSKLAGEFDLIPLEALDEVGRMALRERGIISKRFQNQVQPGAVLVTRDESVSIMLCEEDHIKITVRMAGEQLKAAYSKADVIDNVFIDNLRVAFDKNYGFLTSDPTRIGTGVRASLLLHLPAIKGHRMINALSEMVNKLGFSIKEAMGGRGDLFELSNEISLGISEENAIDNLLAITDQIVKQERALRKEMLKYGDFEDRLYRALGTLKMARRLSADELYNLLSIARVGISEALSDDNEAISYNQLNDFLFTLGDATIITNNNANQQLAEKLRADYIRERLNRA